MSKLTMIVSLGNHQGIVMAVREDSKMVAFDIEEISPHLTIEHAALEALRDVKESDWMTAYELFDYLERGQ